MLIRDIMIAQPIHVSPDTLLSEVVETMASKRIGFMVVANQGKAVGVLTEGDLVALAALQTDMKNSVAAKHMHSPVFSVQADANIFHAYDELVLQKMRHLVVEDEAGDLAGVVTMSSFIANLGVEHFSELQTIADILNPIETTVSPCTPLIEAIQLMKTCGHAMVALDRGKPAGILTSRGIVRLCMQSQEQLASLTVADVMRSPACINRKAFVPEASGLMKQQNTRHLIAIGDHDEFMGLVTISDVAQSMEGRYVEFMRTVMRDMEHDLLAVGGQNRALFERNPNAVFSLDIAGEISHVNPAGILLTGYGTDSLLGKHISELYENDCKDEGNKAFTSAIQGEAQSVHIRMHGSGHSIIHVFMSFVPITVEGSISGVYSVAFDITERVLAEVRLHKLSQALQQAGEPIAISDSHGIIEFANKKMHHLFNYESGALVNMKLSMLEQKCDGLSKYKELVWPSIAEGVPYKGEFMHQTKSGDTLDLRLSCAPVHVPGAERIDYFVNIYEDMTLRRDAEQNALQAQKLETIGTLAGGIAHDFNNYLGAVSGSLYLIKREAADMPHTVERLNKLEALTDRAASLVSQLLTFSRKDKPIKEVISFSGVIEETIELSQLLVPKNVVVHNQIGKHVYVDGNAGQLQQVLLNLMSNACDASKDSNNPQVTVNLSTIEIDSELAHRNGVKEGERYALLSVTDNGRGIDEGIREVIFDPFFTTKDVGEGTGMGLAMVYGAVQSHLGWIDSSPNTGTGTEFKVYLPIARKPEAQLLSSLNESAPTLLLVDDEPMMLVIGTEVLESLGYQTIACDNGEDAVNLFREQPDHFSAVVLDVMMPRQNGPETALALRKIRANLPILFATGYDHHAVSKELLAQPGISLIKKPWKPEFLESTLQSLLGGYGES